MLIRLILSVCVACLTIVTAQAQARPDFSGTRERDHPLAQRLHAHTIAVVCSTN
jgi:hypothetical protein